MTTDITELAQSLKAAAEKAGLEQWVNNRGEVNTADYELDGGVYIDHICNCEIVGTESPRAEFIALANPANVLALVEALEKAQTINAAAEKLVRCKGRYHSEQNYRALAALFGVTAPDLPPLDGDSCTVTIEPFRSFVTDADLAALHRFAECCDDPESGGHDLEKEQVRRLEEIGALRRSGRVHWITGFGDVLISIASGIKWEAE
ncbi:ead/Ea22-like family protein [Klebsiella michiganensis]|uniref:ead/Ea22-like family protein n=1 Tax=Klebsiella michiganensis TaxID=1134687 RepID=UPI0022DE81C8|nr:ead/Ea22-like family protein [Klebsiella michiganensis]